MSVPKKKRLIIWLVVTIAFGLALPSVFTARGAETEAGKTLIVYFPRTGNTRSVCKALQKALDADLIEIKDVTGRPLKKGQKPIIMPEKVDLKPYASVIIGSPIWATKLVPAIDAFLEKNRLDGKKAVILTTANVNMPGKFQAANRKTVQQTGAVVSGYFEVTVQAGPKDARENRNRSQIVEDALRLVPAIKRLL